MAETLELRIEKLAGLGDGMGLHAGRKVFVPYTVEGDFIRARIVKNTADAAYGVIEEIIESGAGRVTPPCRHFAKCGGCQLQHINDTAYAYFKLTMATEAVRKAGFDPACVQPMIKLPAASRRRAEFKIRNGAIGFYEEGSHALVDMEDCKVLESGLLELILQIKKDLPLMPMLTGLQVNGLDNGYDIVFYGRGAEFSAEDYKQVIRLSDDKMKTIYQSSPATLSFGAVTVDVPPGAFLQASHAAQKMMTELVIAGVGKAANVIDLFSGIGTYSFPLSENAAVTAAEGDKAMVEAMAQAAKKYGKKLKAERKDLFKNPVHAATLNDFDAIVINPPRAGAKAQSEQIALSKVKRLVMVSCNPATFTRDARILGQGGYKLLKVIPVDQFVYSAHLELVAEFQK